MKVLCFLRKRKLNCVTWAVLMVLSAAVYTAAPVEAKINDSVTFKWNANSETESIVGYRLYFGKQSRYDSYGRLKTNFQYDYCVDVEELTRCSGTDFRNCKYLNSIELNCRYLYSKSPQCTLKNVSGSKYFALTAYNIYGESSFTTELEKVGSGLLPSTQTAVFSLLLKDG